MNDRLLRQATNKLSLPHPPIPKPRPPTPKPRPPSWGRPPAPPRAPLAGGAVEATVILVAAFISSLFRFRMHLRTLTMMKPPVGAGDGCVLQCVRHLVVFSCIQGLKPEDGHRCQDTGDLRDAPNQGNTGTSPSSFSTSPTQTRERRYTYLRGGSAEHDGSAVSTCEARKRQQYAHPGHMCPSTNEVTSLPLSRWKVVGASR